MKRVGVIHSLGFDPIALGKVDDPDFMAALNVDLERTRQNLAMTFPGVRFMVVGFGSSAVFEFDDEDESLTDRVLPISDLAESS